MSEKNYLEIEKNDGSIEHVDELHIDAETSKDIFYRTGVVNKITVYVKESILK